MPKELFEFNTPDCTSSTGRIPTTRDVVYFPPKLTYGDQTFDNQWSKFSGRGVIGLFKATTNIVQSPEDLTTSSWGNTYSTDAISDYYFNGKRFTKIISTDSSMKYFYVAQNPLLAASVYSINILLKKGISPDPDSTTYFQVQLNDSGTTSRLNVQVPWDKSTPFILFGAGTLISYKWYGDVCELSIAGNSTCAAGIAQYLVVAMVSTTNNLTSSHYFYATAVQLENSAFPTPYTATGRTGGALKYPFTWSRAGIVECWVYLWGGADNLDHGIWDSRREDPLTINTHALLLNKTSANKFQFAGFANTASDVLAIFSSVKSDAELRRWNHIKCIWNTINDTKCKMYINGIDQDITGTRTIYGTGFTGANLDLDQRLIIGKDASIPALQYHLDGLITDLCVWNETEPELMLFRDCERTAAPHLVGQAGDTLSTCTFARSSDFVHSGTYSYKFTKSSAVGNYGIVDFHDHKSSTTTDLAGLIPGYTYTAGLWIYIPTASGIQASEINFMCEDYAGSWQATGIAPSAIYDQWQYITWTRTIRSNATGLAIELYADNNAALNEYFYVDDISLKKYGSGTLTLDTSTTHYTKNKPYNVKNRLLGLNNKFKNDQFGNYYTEGEIVSSNLTTKSNTSVEGTLKIGGTELRAINHLASGDELNVSTNELFELNTAECSSSFGRLPTTNNSVYFPAKLTYNGVNTYDNLWNKFTGRGTIGVFKATTNLVQSPEDLSVSPWASDGGATRSLTSNYFNGKCFTLITQTVANQGITQTLTTASAVAYSVTTTAKKGSNVTDSMILVYENGASQIRLWVYINWTTKTASIGSSYGTLVSQQWYGTDIVEIRATTNVFAGGNTFYIGLRPSYSTNSATMYATAVQLEASTYPTPYTPTSRSAENITYTKDFGNETTIEGWIRLWVPTTGVNDTIFTLSSGNASQIFTCYFSTDADYVVFYIGDPGWNNYRYCGSPNITASINSWHHFKWLFNISAQTTSLYFDGVYCGPNALGTISTFSLPTSFTLGGANVEGHQIADLCIWPTNDTSTTHYTSGRPYYDKNRILGQDCDWKIG